MKLMLAVAPGANAGTAEELFDALSDTCHPAGSLVVNVPRTTDDISPRHDLPQALFLPHVRGEVAMLIEHTSGRNGLAEDVFECLSGLCRAAGFGVSSGYVVNETVMRDHAQSWPEGQKSTGLKAVSIGQRRSGMTVEQFEKYWREVHGPLALKHHIGMSRYVQNLVIDRLGAARNDVDSITEMHFPTLSDFITGLYDSPEGRRTIAADVKKFGGGGDTYFFEEIILRRRAVSYPNEI